MKISDFIKVLQKIQGMMGDIKISMYAPKAKSFGGFHSVCLKDDKGNFRIAFIGEEDIAEFKKDHNTSLTSVDAMKVITNNDK